jgi:hypothetical protein
MINASAAGEQVWVSAGTYKPKYKANVAWTAAPGVPAATPSDRDNAFVLRDDVGLYGGFPTAGSPAGSDRHPENNGTILSGDFGAGNEAYHVVIGAGLSAATVFDGFTIEKGNANNSGSVTVNGQSFAQNHGGGMYNRNSSPTLANVLIRGNAVIGNGGGMYNNASSPHLEGVTLSGNNAASGGGMYNEAASSPKLSYVTISENTTTGNGAGILNDNSSPILDHVEISLNNSSTSGGGMYNDNSSPILINGCVISENTSNGNGGGMYNDSSNPVLINIKITGNTSSSSGGGMYANSDTVLVNVLISGNAASSNGGGIYSDTPSSRLFNVTISGNYSGGSGGGVFNNVVSSVFRNSIIWGNGAAGSDPNVSGTGSTYHHSLVQGNGNSGSNIDADPRFVAPISPTPTATTGGDYRLQSDSPAIGEGNILLHYPPTATGSAGAVLAIIYFGANVPLSAATVINTAITNYGIHEYFQYDIRGEGNDRIKSGTIDMGAYEY